MTSSNVIAVDDTSFDARVLGSDRTVLIKFSTKQCPPCRALFPIVERIATEAADRCRVFSVDIDDAPLTAARYGIRAVPTLLAFRNGGPRGQLIGLASRAAILKLI